MRFAYALGFLIIVSMNAWSQDVVLEPRNEKEDAARAKTCGALPERACAHLLLAIGAWNDRFGDVAIAEGFEYRGDPTTQAEKLLEQITSPDAVLPVVAEERPVGIAPRRNAEIASADLTRWRSQIESILRNTKHAVQINWKLKDGKFVTTSLLSDSILVYDNILTNVRERRSSNSCVHEQILWIWGGVSGEIKIDLVPIYEEGRIVACAGSNRDYLMLGTSESRISPSKVRHGRCFARYAWAWATPVATISFNASKFKFEIRGLGSRGSGSGECWSPRP
ncbi:MAG TPA: hypothetical protein VE974_30385 [Thermoanaerobaculia bacterium]|nr:hypothetical protein [Thermoanaerobaculia bacterium]